MRNMEERFTYTDTYARPMFDRGFTGHEHLYAFDLINMNGRMYDPVMSSFLSADRYIQDPTGWVAGVGGGHHSISINQCVNESSIDGRIEYGFDAFIGFAGVIAPEFFALPSTI